jgi:glycosyltransferase involved in cell wall biosynthesis
MIARLAHRSEPLDARTAEHPPGAPHATPRRRIGVFIRNLQGGGAERVAVTVANQLSTRHDVRLYLLDEQGPYRRAVAPQVLVEPMTSRRLSTAAPELRRRLRADRIDVLLSHLTHENLVAALSVLGTGIRLVAVEHNNLDAEIADRGRVNAMLTRGLYRLLHARMDTVVAVSDGVARELSRRYGAQRVVAIHNPIISPDIDAALARPTEEPLPEAPYLVFAGRLSTQKNPALALHAMALLVSRHGYAGRLVMLGDGPLRQDMERLALDLGIARRVEFRGFVANPYAYMRGADALVLTSSWEGFGNVLVEALHAGTRVVATDCPYGPAEIIDSREMGELVGDLNPEAFARAVQAALATPKTSALRRERVARFCVDAVCERYERLLCA